METSQLKKIIILILALVNLALLFLLLSSVFQQRRAQEEELRQLRQLYASSGITLEEDVFSDAAPAPARSVVRDENAERGFAQALLGDVSAQETGSMTVYTSAAGTLRIRHNGAFELHCSAPFLPQTDCMALLEALPNPLRTAETLAVSGSGTLRCTQYVDERPVLTGSTVLRFENGLLTSAEGYYLCSTQERSDVSGRSLTDALSVFLTYCRENGVICNRVDTAQPAWLLSTETLFQSALLPVWLIRTDSNEYYVNCSTGEVLVLAS